MSNLPARMTKGSVVAVDLDRLDHDLAAKAIERISAKANIGGGNVKRLFPGTQIGFKKDTFQLGTGKKAQDIDPPRLVVNFPHLGLVYTKFEDKGGRFVPHFSDLCMPMLGQDLVDRESLGDLDEDEWDQSDDGRPMDPWKLNVVFPVRDENGTEYDHLVANNPTNQNALMALFKEANEEAKLKPGKLPVVQFSARKLESEKDVQQKNGKTKKQKLSWQGMGYEIVGWVKVAACDKLNQGVDMGEDSGEEVDTGKVKATRRVADSAPPAKGKAAPKAIADKGKSASSKGRQKVAIDDADL